MKQFSIKHTGFQKVDKLNFKTTGLPWQQSKQDQETARNAQSKETLNPTNLKRRLQPAAKNLKTKYNNFCIYLVCIVSWFISILFSILLQNSMPNKFIHLKPFGGKILLIIIFIL